MIHNSLDNIKIVNQNNFKKERKHERISFYNGSVWENSFIRIYYQKSKEKYCRYFIAISRDCGTSVERNKLKRIAREFLRGKISLFEKALTFKIRIITKQGLQEKKSIENSILEWIKYIKRY